jgi:hypothetical protein
MAFAMEPDQIGKFCNSFKSFYNSKNQGYVDLELHNKFDNKALHNVGFTEGTVLALWSGLLKRSNPTAPRNCTPFAFKELMPINMNEKSRSLIITMINQKGSLSQSSDEIKAKAKQDIATPRDFHEIVFQLKAFLALLEHCHKEDQRICPTHQTEQHLLQRMLVQQQTLPNKSLVDGLLPLPAFLGVLPKSRQKGRSR